MKMNTMQWFLIVIACLIIFGLIFIYSASSAYALEKTGVAHFFVKKQLYGLIIGIIGMLICSLIPLSIIERLAGVLFCFASALVALTLIPAFAHTIHGSSRWLTIGPLQFQPSELLKAATILFLARVLAASHIREALSSQQKLLIGMIICTPALLLLQQPDFGMTLTIVCTALLMMFIIRFSYSYAIGLLSLVASASLVLIVKYPYRLKRILVFFNPWNDPQGAGFQIIQSLIAIGSGGWSGVGISYSKQKFFYLPMQHTDFIFSIIAEEIGFVGTTLLIVLYWLFLLCGLKIAWETRSLFCTLYTFGFTIITSIQAGINMAVALGLLPTKGTGLPFISSGNSALVINLCFVGIIINGYRTQKKAQQSRAYAPSFAH